MEVGKVTDLVPVLDRATQGREAPWPVMATAARTWGWAQGENDIVPFDDPCLVIEQVATWRPLAFVAPVKAVASAKPARVRRVGRRQGAVAP